jgi:acyl-coenzyme A thioesterase PaaI-like protein
MFCVMTNDVLPDWLQAEGFAYDDLDENGPPANGFEHLLGLMCYRRRDDMHEMMMRIEPRHANSGKLAHGAMLAAATDIACSRAYWNHLGRPRYGFVTVSLSHDFVGPVLLETWLLARCRVRQDGGSLGFIDCEMFVDGKLVALSRCVMKKLKKP